MDILIQISPIIVMIVLFYLIIYVPENKRKKKYSAMVNSLKLNDEIVTRGGIIGKIINIQDDFVIVQSGPDKARFKLSKSGVASLLSSNEIEEKK